MSDGFYTGLDFVSFKGYGLKTGLVVGQSGEAFFVFMPLQKTKLIDLVFGFSKFGFQKSLVLILRIIGSLVWFFWILDIVFDQSTSGTNVDSFNNLCNWNNALFLEYGYYLAFRKTTFVKKEIYENCKEAGFAVML